MRPLPASLRCTVSSLVGLLSLAFANGLQAGGDQTALEKFYGWPASPEFPIPQGDGYWDWKPEAKSEGPSLLDLRSLNEAVAGQSGWVTARGDKLYLGDGRPVRFWSVNAMGDAPVAELQAMNRELARRGVNLVRIHGGASKSLLDFSAESLEAVNREVIDQMHRAVVAAKRNGIYLFASNQFFIIEYKVKASHGLEGYTQAWLDAHPDQRVPFGLIFLNDKLRGAYKGWLREMVTAPNPYDEQKTPLARDHAVAVMEILNEENLFFWTFQPATWPREQRDLTASKFFNWLATKHRTAGDADAQATVKRVVEGWGTPHAEDAVSEGRVALLPVADFGHRPELAKRSADQIAYLHEVQRGFHEEMTAMLRELGFGGLVSPSNWATANDSVLLDLEHDTYRVGGLIDRHAYYSPVVEKVEQGWRVSRGDTFLSFSATATPAAASFVVRQTEGSPSAMSEFAWVNYNPAGAEGPLMAAAYFSLTDFDMPIWFALPTSLWSAHMYKWPVGNPATLGQFPGAALLYRRGDVAEAPVVVREHRPFTDLYARKPALLMPGRGFDATRDIRDRVSNKAASELNPLAMLVGKVEVSYEPGENTVSPAVAENIDAAAGRVRSATGEVVTDWKAGICKVDTPRAQGIAGFLHASGTVQLGDVTLASGNRMGSLLVIALDDLPLSQSRRVLIQAGTLDRLTGFRATVVPVAHEKRERAGVRIDELGQLPWQVENVDATVRLRGLGARVLRAVALDPAGREQAQVTGKQDGADYVLRLPKDSLYTIVELSAP
ncbi:hypothetical protein [Nibricoccus sp. IMCC34717]|uniref:hypothetical protein n=1 Tax=Nibricoccus sp. IMCC34717 TaxID=3034021 RepID=UPI00384DB3D5